MPVAERAAHIANIGDLHIDTCKHNTSPRQIFSVIIADFPEKANKNDLFPQ
jgi:hypothetical protein